VVSIGERLVGRAETCGVFDDALSELDGGRSAALALVGEPGIGKTRLLAELAARADARGQLVLYGSASERAARPLRVGIGARARLAVRVRAETHHPLDAGAVVPGAVEEDDLSRGRQVRDIALEVRGPRSSRRAGSAARRCA
jgi:hypothetical protein